MDTMNHNIIVLGSHTTALYVVRSFGRLGVKVAIIDTNPFGEARFSKNCVVFAKISHFGHKELKDAIGTISGKLGPCAIFPTTDESVKCLADLIDQLGDDHVAIIPPWSITGQAYDKRATYDLARTCDVPIPNTYYLESTQDIIDIARSCKFPVLVKPTTTVSFRSTFHAKAIAAQNRSDLLCKFERVVEKIDPRSVLVQELIPGVNKHFWHYGAVFNRDQPAFEYVISRKRQYPIDFGTASHAEIVDNPEVAELGARILTAMGFSGPVEVQFKYDERTNMYMLLDVNPRFWKSCAIADLLGVNMPLLAYELQIGKAADAVAQITDQRLIWFDILPDIVVSAREILSGTLSLREWLASYRGRRIEATFSRDDVWPGIVLALMAPISYLKGIN